MIFKKINRIIDFPIFSPFFDRENPFGEEQLFLNNTEVLYASHFNESRPTKFLIHGFSDTGNEAWVRGLIEGTQTRLIETATRRSPAKISEKRDRGGGGRRPILEAHF